MRHALPPLAALACAVGVALAAAAGAAEEVFDPVSVLGPAPKMPAIGGGPGRVPCEQPEVANLPRCRAWREAYDDWQAKAQALMKEHAEQAGK